MKTICKYLMLALLIPAFVLCGKKEPVVKYDYEQIVNKGELTALTLSGSLSYFIYKGIPMGYEYELLKSFADAHNLRLNIKVAENVNKLNAMLTDGEGDLIAYNIPITLEGKDSMLYCGRENIDEQVLIQRANRKDTILNDVTQMIGKEIWVLKDSKYYKRLLNLNDELGGGILIRDIEKDTVSSEDLIEMVSRGKIPYTVSDNNIAKLNKTYFSNININLRISHPQRSSWAVRKDCPSLADTLNAWFQSYQKDPQYTAIAKRYFEMSKLYDGNGPSPLLAGHGHISPFDNLFKKYAPQIGWDWRLLASIAYQESKFTTNRTSWAGASGLMGLMPNTAKAFGLPPDQRTDPDGSIQASVKYIRALFKCFSIDKSDPDEIKFILAAYNCGVGHVYDAQALAEKYGKNPDNWSDVEEFLRLKSLPEYYNDPVCKQGYFRSTETINYVSEVMDRWKYYQEKVKK